MRNYFESLFSVAGKTALVTGGASGLGLMLGEALVRGGARVLIASRKLDQCEIAAKTLGALGAGSAEALRGDVSSEAGVAALAGEVAKRTEKLHILVNNAGRTWGAKLGEFPHSAWESVFAVNVAGLFSLTQALLPQLKAAASSEDPARVINLGSTAALQPMGDGAYSYAASKAAVHHLTYILAKELADQRITVNALAPGAFESRMTAFATKDEVRKAGVVRQIPLRRLGSGADLASAALYLCGPGGAYVTGAVLPVDGGLSVDAGHDLYEARSQ